MSKQRRGNCVYTSTQVIKIIPPARLNIQELLCVQRKDCEYLLHGDIDGDIRGNILLITPRYKCDLHQLLPNIGVIDGLNIFHDVLEGVRYLHDRGFVHGDLKPSNIFCGPGVVIGDFGHTRKIEHNLVQRDAGTRGYQAPELIISGSWSFATDIWSLGCIFHEICFGERVIPPQQEKEAYYYSTIDWIARLNDEPPPNPTMNFRFTPLPPTHTFDIDRYRRWFAKDPQLRPTIHELLEWI